jgi:hypothetical protein
MKQQILQSIELMTVGQESSLKAKQYVTGCAVCTPSASRPFQSVLDQVFGSVDTTEYFLCSPVECPKCASPILETTLVSVEEQSRSGHKTLSLLESAPHETNVVFVDEPTLAEAQEYISGCQHCASDAADITFDYLLDAVTGSNPAVTEYVICHGATCPRCHYPVMEKTLIVSE